MDLERQVSQPLGSQSSDNGLDFAQPPVRKPLILLRDTERSLRVRTLDAIAPLLPSDLALTLGEASHQADKSLEELSQIDLEEITDADLKSARILIGLTFVGFGGLTMMFLAFCLSILRPELSAIAQIHEYWHPYIWFISMGVAGLTMLGREAMRPSDHE